MDHFYEKIEGFFNYEEVYRKVIEECPEDSHFVEIGCWLGKSVCYAGVEIVNSGKKIMLDAVDSWQGSAEQDLFSLTTIKPDEIYDVFLKNIEPVNNVINPIKMLSVDAAKTYSDQSLDFVFIDGSHLYEDVKNDIIAWLPKVKRNGYIGGHDYHEDVARAVNELIDEKNIEIFNPHWASWLYKLQ